MNTALRKPKSPKHSQDMLAQLMGQMCFDFESSPSVMGAIYAESATPMPSLLEQPRAPWPTFSDALELKKAASVVPAPAHHAKHVPDSDEQDLNFENGSYIRLCIDLLLTCAEDLVICPAILEKGVGTKEYLGKIQQRLDDARDWLEQTVDSPFTFKQCAELLEDELRIQSMGQVTIPRIGDQSEVLADWILDNPEQAKHTLGHYKRIFIPQEFSNFGESDFDAAESENARTSAAPARERFAG